MKYVKLASKGILVAITLVQALGCGRANLELASYLFPAKVDTSFGGGGASGLGAGLAVVDFGAGARGLRMLSTAGDKLLVAGSMTVSNTKSVVLAQLGSTGMLDPAFGTLGKATGVFATGAGDRLNGVAIDPTGGVYAAGQVANHFGITDYFWTGSYDTGFGSGGSAQTNMSAGIDTAYDIIRQPNGKTIVVGSADTLTINPNFALARYNANGTLDTCFGDVLCLLGGKVMLDFVLHKNEAATTVTLDSAGAIYAAGFTTTLSGDKDFGITKLGSSGIIDLTFGTLGYSTIQVSGLDDGASTIALQSDGKIILAGYSMVAGIGNKQMAIVRLNTSGVLDTSFGSGGRVLVNVNSGYDSEALALLYSPGDGGICVGGYANVGGKEQMAIVRLTSSGALDPAFGTNGVWVGAGSGYFGRFYQLAFDVSGRLLALGQWYNGTYESPAVMRFSN